MTVTHGPTGTRSRDGATNVITFVRTLDAAPDRVWTALTTDAGLMSWLAPQATIEPREGGDVRLTFDEENLVTGTITEFDPPRGLTYTWTIDGDVESTVRFTLTPSGEGTELTLVHRGLPDEMCGGYTPGWHAYLVRLEAVTDGDTPPSWLEVFEAVAQEYA